VTKQKTRRRGKQPRRSAAEYFLAATGLAIVAFLVALAFSFRSCHFTVPGLVPEPAVTPTPARTPS
jgi:hypothetical protein